MREQTLMSHDGDKSRCKDEAIELQRLDRDTLGAFARPNLEVEHAQTKAAPKRCESEQEAEVFARQKDEDEQAERQHAAPKI